MNTLDHEPYTIEITERNWDGRIIRRRVLVYNLAQYYLYLRTSLTLRVIG